MSREIVPILPSYFAPPNKFLKYDMEEFNDGHGNGGRIRYAYFINKKGKTCKTEAQVYWDYGWFAGITEEDFKKGD